MQTLVEMLRCSAERTPAAPCLILRTETDRQCWTYRDLWETAQRVAAHLRAEGIERGDRVVLWGENRPEWVAAFYGCLLAGVIVVPFDVRAHEGFLRRIEEQTQPRLLFAGRSQLATAGPGHPPAQPLEDLRALVQFRVPVSLPPPAPDDIVELLYTSGTTGDPKGVILRHRNIIANLRSIDQVVAVQPTWRLLSILPLSHVFEQTVGLNMVLRAGASVVYVETLQPRLLFQAMAEEQITAVACVPQVLQLFLRGIEQEVRRQGKERAWRLLHTLAPFLPFPLRRLLFRQVHRRLGGRFEFFACGGAYLDPALAQRWENMGIKVVQGYGMTEAAPIVSLNSLAERNLRSVGRVAPGVEVRIAPDGEILVRGENVFSGYWQNEAATAAAFTPDGWYRTGDLGELDRAGWLYFRGRKKNLIVLPNGLNVYPEDVENALTQTGLVLDAVVCGLDRPDGGVEIHAVLLMEDPAQASAAVRAANRLLSPHQAIRSYSVWPEKDFPRTHTLKVKRAEVLAWLRAQRASVPTA